MSSEHSSSARLLLQPTDRLWTKGMHHSRLTQIVCSCMLTALLLTAVLLDFFFTWSKSTKGYTSGLFIAIAVFNIVFFIYNFFQVVFAFKDYERWRSVIVFSALIFGTAAQGAAIIRLMIGSYETGGMILVITFVQVGYNRGLDWREKLRLQQLQRSASTYHQV